MLAELRSSADMARTKLDQQENQFKTLNDNLHRARERYAQD